MIPVTLPQLSLAMDEGKIGRWLVADGDMVRAGQPIVEIETDKAIAEVQAPVAGTIRCSVAEGAVVLVDSVLAEIAEVATAADVPLPATALPTGDPMTPAAKRERQAEYHYTAEGAATACAHKNIASPAARRVARERGIDLAHLTGTGPDGRITVKDLEAAKKSSLRETVVAHVAASWREIPHIHVGGELDGTGLAAAKRAAPPGVTVTDLLVLAIVGAVREVPEVNGTMGVLSRAVHLSLAVATPNGVIAPVIRSANDLSLVEIARERARLVAAARAGTSDRRDLAGGTITMSNLGSYPVDFFAPVISGPQIAMIAVGRLVERPFATSGIVSVRNRIWMNLAIDHRAADGMSGARFLAAMEHFMNDLPTIKA